MDRESWWSLIKDTFIEIRNRDFKRLAAALAHYMSFSIIPALIVVAALGSVLIDEDDLTEDILAPIEQIANPETAQLVNDAIRATRDGVGENLPAAALSALALLYGASRMFRHLKYSINWLWGVEESKQTEVTRFVRDSIISMLFVLLFGVLIVGALLLNAVLFAVFQSIDDAVPDASGIELVQVGGFVLLALFLTLIFTIIYKFMPSASVHWRDVWIGAGMTSLLFTLGQFVVGLYIDIADVGTVYGAAASIMVVLIWVYVSAHLILFGARFTYLYARRHGETSAETLPSAPDTTPAAR